MPDTAVIDFNAGIDMIDVCAGLENLTRIGLRVCFQHNIGYQ